MATQPIDRVSFPMPRHDPLDPPPGYRAIREKASITPATMTTGKRQDVWLVTRFQEARTVLADTRFSSDPSLEGYPLVRERSALIRMDPPDHTRFRRMLAAEFVPRRIERLRADVERLCADLLDVLDERDEPADLVSGLALPLPSMVICTLLGVPDHLRGDLVEQSSRALSKLSSDAEIEEAVAALGDVLEAVVTAKEADPTDDVLGRLVTERVQRGECRHDEAVDLARLLLVAGHVTTVNMIGLGVVTLALHPEHLPALVGGGETLGAIVDELMRLHAITGAIARVATHDTVIGGQQIRAGDGVLVLLSAANRDPRRFAAPDEFDPSRDASQHLSFGHGPHLCLGMHLARLELGVVLPALWRRFPRLRLTRSLDDLSFRHEMRIYGLHELPVAWS